jgi:hypothetical protein
MCAGISGRIWCFAVLLSYCGECEFARPGAAQKGPILRNTVDLTGLAQHQRMSISKSDCNIEYFHAMWPRFD